MQTRYTDAENTGAPMVPMVATDDASGGESHGRRREREEVVLSHRLPERN